MERSEPGGVFAAFTVTRILNDGMTTVLACEAASALAGPPRRDSPATVELGGAPGERVRMLPGAGRRAVAHERRHHPGGLGHGIQGWQAEGVLAQLPDRRPVAPNCQRSSTARRRCGGRRRRGMVVMRCHRGQIVNI